MNKLVVRIGVQILGFERLRRLSEVLRLQESR